MFQNVERRGFKIRAVRNFFRTYVNRSRGLNWLEINFGGRGKELEILTGLHPERGRRKPT
jgi:hypothetical protein